MSEEKSGASQRKPLPILATYSYVSFDGTLKDPETIELIFYYLKHAGGGEPVNVKIEDHVITVYPEDDVAWMERRHKEQSVIAQGAIFGERRKRNLGRAPNPLLPPKQEPSE